MSDTIKAIAFAVLTVIAIYFVVTLLGKAGANWRVFLPLDILVYLGIGFFSARVLRSWRGGFAVVAIAAVVDVVLAVGSLILPGAPRMSPTLLARAESIEVGVNLFVGFAGAAIGYAIRRDPA